MDDPLIALINIAGSTLLVTLLWALTLIIVYWDIQRRKQAGERVNTPAWMLVVAYVPFVGLVFYFLVRLLAPKGSGRARRGSRRETKRKAQAAEGGSAPVDKKPMPTILATEYNKETVLNQPGPALVESAEPGTLSFQFTVMNGPDQGKIFRVERFPAQIGRDLNSVIRLELDEGVSRQHALIYMINGVLRIRDLQSTHGTWVNKKPITDQVLKPGDQIDVGLSSVMYEHSGG